MNRKNRLNLKNSRSRIVLILLLGFIFCGFLTPEARKVKNSFRIDKSSKEKVLSAKGKSIEGREITVADSPADEVADSSADEVANSSIDCGESEIRTLQENLRKCVFSGYDKEATSSNESFILSNPTDRTITGFKVRIDYLDMKNRMLHSREVEASCFIPPGESRRIDIKSWDLQHVYYYYLGNEPRRVATPFQVAFHPMSVWIMDE